MSDTSLAERAFTNMVSTSPAPPSFGGQGWLVALNLFAMTAGFCLTMMLAGKIVRDMWRNRYRDKFCPRLNDSDALSITSNPDC